MALPAQLASPFAASMPALAQPLTPYRVLDVDGSVIGELPSLADEDFRALLRWMIFGRELDRRALQLQRQGRITVWGPMSGQEATQAGLGFALDAQDLLFPSYREAITLCIQGLDLADLLAYYRGLYWLADPAATGVYPIQIVIGDQTLHAVGAGLGFALQDLARVGVAVIGDGATSEGDFHEALNFAGVLHARSVIFVQNNGWAISMPTAGQTASPTIAQKALGYGIPGILVDGNDPLAVFASSRWALDHARAGEGPVLVEALTYRLGAHTTADDPRRYQPAEEIEAWRQRDPLVRMRRFLEHAGLWSPSDADAASADALARIDAAFARAEAIATPSFERVVGSTFAMPTAPLREQLRQLEAEA
ncbi:MAG: pyruvate dehydrogenase (acetyl-transferring) E1 component subunit alpha [Chloroflexi bacterium]|nr:pyruvate dehydrogenase (acetyl-transferring) E1 component subunit alpha [Chloroflexota bacterium]